MRSVLQVATILGVTIWFWTLEEKSLIDYSNYNGITRILDLQCNMLYVLHALHRLHAVHTYIHYIHARIV